MTIDATVTLIETEKELLEIVPLKQADDSEAIGKPISAGNGLDKIMRLNGPSYNFWIVRVNGAPVGYAVGKRDGERYKGEGVYVTPEQRGIGIGPLALQRQVDYAKAHGFIEFWSVVSGENRHSIKMLQKLGFKFEPSGQGYEVRLKLQEEILI